MMKRKNYCLICQKQCKDQNGFRCHMNSQSHLSKTKGYAQNPQESKASFSQIFLRSFLQLLKSRYRNTPVQISSVYEQYLGTKNHVSLQATLWKSLKHFITYLQQNQSKVKIIHSQDGIMVKYGNKISEQERQMLIMKQEGQRRRKKQIKQRKILQKQINISKQIQNNINLKQKQLLKEEGLNASIQFKLQQKKTQQPKPTQSLFDDQSEQQQVKIPKKTSNLGSLLHRINQNKKHGKY